jgi:prepilin-type N-terminal cleavage/methylation domain-containing protein
MRTMNRRGARPEYREGFTLVELLLGLTVLGIVAGTATAVVLGVSRAATRATRSLVADRALQSLQVFLRQELRDATNADVAVMASTRIALARPIGEAMVCAASDTAILVADSAWTGTRWPEPGRDDAWLLVDPVAAAWQAAAIVAVAADQCPADLAPAIRLSLSAPPTGTVVVRIMEPVELSAYRSGIADWFGLTPANHAAAVQPFAGPLTPGTSRWVLYADRLETAMQPNGAAATIVLIPLAAGP